MKDIKKTYHDALFFASSPSNKKENFYLTPSEFKVLIKLMMYQRNNSDITYQNKTIAEHIFLAESTVKDAMEALARMAYISTELDVFNNGLGFKSKRTVRINWKRIEEIDNKISNEEVLESKIPTEVIPKVQVEVMVSQIEDKSVKTEHYIKYKTKWNNERDRFDYGDLCSFDSKFIPDNTGITFYNFRIFVKDIKLDRELLFEDFLIKCDNFVIENQKQLV